jgi:hypothetical protein
MILFVTQDDINRWWGLVGNDLPPSLGPAMYPINRIKVIDCSLVSESVLYNIVKEPFSFHLSAECFMR